MYKSEYREQKDISGVLELTFLGGYTTLFFYKFNDLRIFNYIRVDVNDGGMGVNI